MFDYIIVLICCISFFHTKLQLTLRQYMQVGLCFDLCCRHITLTRYVFISIRYVHKPHMWHGPTCMKKRSHWERSHDFKSRTSPIPKWTRKYVQSLIPIPLYNGSTHSLAFFVFCALFFFFTFSILWYLLWILTIFSFFYLNPVRYSHISINESSRFLWFRHG